MSEIIPGMPETTVPVVIYRCRECGAEWNPFGIKDVKDAPHYRGCSKIKIPVAFLASQPQTGSLNPT